MKIKWYRVLCVLGRHNTTESSCPFTGLTYTVCYKCGKILYAK